METYKRIDEDTLEITTTYTQLVKKEDLEREKEMFVNDKNQNQIHIDEVDAKLTVLTKVTLPTI